MLDIFRLAGEATRRPRPDGTTQRGYWASYFLRGVRNHGGPDYARQLLRAVGTSAGFQRLTDEGRLDLTVETLVLRPEYEALFTAADRTIAAHRLAEAGYVPAAHRSLLPVANGGLVSPRCDPTPPPTPHPATPAPTHPCR